jgi:site-specific recombinase XerD
MATTRSIAPTPLQERFRDLLYDGRSFLAQLTGAMAGMGFHPHARQHILRTFDPLCCALETCHGLTLQQRWRDFEQHIWPRWLAGQERPPGKWWTGSVRVAVTARLVQPAWELLCSSNTATWMKYLPEHDPLAHQVNRLKETLASLSWARPAMRAAALNAGLRLLLAHDYHVLEQITEQDLLDMPSAAELGSDTLDAALCVLGIFSRTPKRTGSRHLRKERLSIEELVSQSTIPEPFQKVTALYLHTYAARISSTYQTLRHKVYALAHFWHFIAESFPDVQNCAEILPAHARAFIPYAIERGRKIRRGKAEERDDRVTACNWLMDVRVFFADLCTWATEPDSPFASFAPRTIPLTRHDLVGVGFEQARKRSQARMTATILDLEREMPKIRAYALQHWSETEEARKQAPDNAKRQTAALHAFWDWALLELLVQSGLRVEEACELTTLDILKRRMPDGRIYYMLHVKPSKYDRARVIPIGDGLGRVIAEIIRHVKQFYGTTTVPFCDQWDYHEQLPLPRAPYLLQGAGHPSCITAQTIRTRLHHLSVAAGARTADGVPLALHPHDCRRVFASEHLNNNTPVHVIQALLGHATLDTVMVYAKLYPTQLVDEYRKALHGVYGAVHGEESFRNPTAEEWAAFAASCSLRDMGTHVCALPTGEYCPKGLVCLGCVHAQPKKSAAPIFRRMLASHERALAAAKTRGEPAGQIAAREMEVARLRQALRRAEELTTDVAAAIEEMAEGAVAQ